MKAGQPIQPEKPAPFWQRLLWFIALWAGSVIALGCVGFVIRSLLRS